MTNKLVDNKRRTHAEKILEQNSAASNMKTAPAKTFKKVSTLDSSDQALREQYKVIRQDLSKLRQDLMKGFSLAKNWMGQKSEVIRSK